MIERFISNANDVLYTYVLIILLIAGGIYFSIRTRFVQFRLFGDQIRSVIQKPGQKGSVSSFQALMVSTASRVGTGNIIGVSTALCLGGFGSVFWMWVIALIGAASAFVESTLAQIYKKRTDDGSCGGPAYYIRTAIGSKSLALLFSILLIITYGVGFNMLASYNLQSTFSSYSFYDTEVTPWVVGLIVAFVVCYCLMGGGKRLIKATSLLVPVMGVAYILIALVITLANIHTLPGVISGIFAEAFDASSIFGGFSGSCVMFGIKRGLFSNEAGVGSAPNASASAVVSHPVSQGLVQVLSVFIDTILVCSATAFMCMCSGVEATPEISGAPYVQKALSQTLGNFGPVFITISMVLFAFTTLIGNLYYVDRCIYYIAKRPPKKSIQYVWHISASVIIFVGAILSADLLWSIADITMAAITLINMPVIICLGKYAFAALKDYDLQRKAGKTPVFFAKNINLPHDVDYWK